MNRNKLDNSIRPRTFAAAFLALLVVATPSHAAAQSSAPAKIAASQSAPVPSREDPWVVASVPGTLAERALEWSHGDSDVPTPAMVAGYSEEHSDRTLDRLTRLGVNTLLLPYGGHGPDAFEETERLEWSSFAERARQRGFRVGWRLPLGCVRPEIWSGAGINVDGWLARDAQGKPVPASLAGHTQVNWTAPGFRAHADHLIREVLAREQADFLLLPSFESVGGYELWTPEQFGTRWRELLPAAPAAASQGGVPALPATLPSPDAGDPRLFEAWIRYRAERLTLELDRYAGLLRGVTPPITLGVDTAIRRLAPVPTVGAAYDLPEIAQRAPLLWVEASIVREGPRVLHQIGDLKAATDAGCRVIPPVINPLNLAQTMAFARDTSGCVAWFTNGVVMADANGRAFLEGRTAALIGFLARRHDLYRDPVRVADVVLLRPDPLDVSQPVAETAAYVQTENALASHRIPFTVALDQRLAGLTPRQVLLLAGASRLSDAQVERIRRHLAEGGGLACIGPAGTRDERGAARPRGLCEMLRGESGFRAATDAPAAEKMRCGTIGKARIVEMARPGPPAQYWLLAPRDQSRRPNQRTMPYTDEFYAALRWAAGGRFSATIRLDAAAVFELSRSRDGSRAMLHIVNYDPGRPSSAASAELRISGGRVRRVRQINPLTGNEVSLAFEATPDLITFAVAPCTLYDVYLIEYER